MCPNSLDPHPLPVPSAAPTPAAAASLVMQPFAELATRNLDTSLSMAKLLHELRNASAGILGLARLMIDDPQASSVQRHRAGLIAGTVNDQAALLADMLDLVLLGVAPVRVRPAPVQLASLLDAVISPFRPLAASKGLELTLEINAGLPEMAQLDARRLKQVLMNLLSNALKYTEAGHVQLRVQRQRQPGAADRLAFAVADTGPGIAPEARSRLFAMFQRCGTPMEFKEGHGVGLALSRELVEKLGGRLQCDSVPGVGSQFHFSLELLPI